MRELYILSPVRYTEDGEAGRAVIGVLREITTSTGTPGKPDYKRGIYEIQYKLGGRFRGRHTELLRLDDPAGTYNDEQIKHITEEWTLAPKNFKHTDKIMKRHGFSKYDEWAYMQRQGRLENIGPLALCETLPEGAISYE